MATTILVADADKLTRELMLTVLAREGFEVTALHDGTAVVDRCREQAPRLVICSGSLPGLDAFDLCRDIKAADATTRIILLVGCFELDSQAPHALADKLGCDAVLPRPFRYPAVRDVLIQWDILQPKTRETQRSSPASFSVPIAPLAFDIAAVAPPEPLANAPETLACVTVPETGEQHDTAGTAPFPIPVAPIPAQGIESPASQERSQSGDVGHSRVREDDDTSDAATALEPSLDLGLDAVMAAALEHAPELDHTPEPASNDTPTTETKATDPTLAPLIGRPSFFAASTRSAPPSPQPATPAPTATELSTPSRPPPSDETFDLLPDVPRNIAKTPSALAPSLPLHGQLQQTPLPRILFELYVATFSGRLRLSRLGLTRTIHVWGGLAVRVDTEQVEESLGHMLVEHGRITQQQYETTLRAATQRHIDEVDAVVASGLVNKGELLDILRDLTEQRLVHSFSWRDGSYAIEADGHFGENMVLTEVKPFKSIWQGVGEHYDLVSLMTYFGALRGRYAVATALFGVHCDSFGPLLRHLDVARLLDGKTTFEAALRSDDTRALEIAQALYVLLVTDMVEASPTPGNPIELAERGATGDDVNTPVDYRAITRICDEINQEYLRVKECDFFEALHVQADASTDVVDAAYSATVRPFTLEALPSGLPEDVQRRAAELCTALERARNTLRVREVKERYVIAQRARVPAPRVTEDSAIHAGPPATSAVEPDRASSQDREMRQLAEAAYADAMRLYKASEFEMAKQKFAVAVRLNPGEPSYRVALARTHLAIDAANPSARREAATLLQDATKLDPANVEANYELACLLVAADQANSARPYIMRILQRAPEHREARALLAKIAL